MSLAKESVLAELAEYEAKLAGIEKRHTRTREGVWIGESDAENLLQYVRELIDLLHSVLGKPNEYSRQISDYYDGGLHNMSNSPSLQSVRNIISLVKAVQTYIARPTTVLVQSRGDGIHAATVGSGTWYDVMQSLAKRQDKTENCL